MRKRSIITITWILFGALLFGAGLWAGRATMQAPKVELADESTLYYTVGPASVGKQIPFAIVLTWPLTAVNLGIEDATLTSIEVTDGQTVNAGDILYRRDLRPTIIAEGNIPSFRDLTTGVKGEDVTQLQTLLKTKKYLPAGMKTTTEYTTTIETAVKKWQKDLGIEPDGIVKRNDLLYVKTLPVNIILSADAKIGTPLNELESLVNVISGEAQLKSSVIEGGFQNQKIEVNINDQWVEIQLDRIEQSIDPQDAGQEMAYFKRADGNPICSAGECDGLKPKAGGLSFQARKVIQEAAEGPAVPVAAIIKDDTGKDAVILENGKSVPVQILGQGNGLVVVNGIENGQKIQLPQSSS